MLTILVTLGILTFFIASSLFGPKLKEYNARPRVVKNIVIRPVCPNCSRSSLPEKIRQGLGLPEVKEVELYVKDDIGECSSCGFEARVVA